MVPGFTWRRLGNIQRGKISSSRITRGRLTITANTHPLTKASTISAIMPQEEKESEKKKVRAGKRTRAK